MIVLKKIIKFILSKLNLSTFGNANKEDILNIIKLFKPSHLGYNFMRVGGHKDGSYIIPDNLGKIKYCFSAGYGGISSFEKDLEKLNIKTFLADYSYNKPRNLKKLKYTKKFVKSYSDKNFIDINLWIEKSVQKKHKDMIMQMDIEGGEYEAIYAISEKNLKRFKILIIEFHNLFLTNNQIFNKFLSSCLNKIKKNFEVFFIHPNNNSGVSNFDGLIFPNILEVTFLNKENIKKKTKFVNNFKNFNIKNNPLKNKINLPDYWYN